jgi:hypothetical protein
MLPPDPAPLLPRAAPRLCVAPPDALRPQWLIVLRSEGPRALQNQGCGGVAVPPGGEGLRRLTHPGPPLDRHDGSSPCSACPAPDAVLEVEHLDQRGSILAPCVPGMFQEKRASKATSMVIASRRANLHIAPNRGRRTASAVTSPHPPPGAGPTSKARGSPDYANALLRAPPPPLGRGVFEPRYVPR